MPQVWPDSLHPCSCEILMLLVEFEIPVLLVLVEFELRFSGFGVPESIILLKEPKVCLNCILIH